MRFSQIRILSFSCLLAFSLSAFAGNDFSKPEPLVIQEKQKQAFQLGSNLLSNKHYRGNSLRQVSAQVFDNYLNALDPYHIYFLKSDIEELSEWRTQLAQNVRDADLSAAVAIFERYRQRATDLNAWVQERLQHDVDLESDNTVHIPSGFKEIAQNKVWFDNLDEVHRYQEARLIDSIIRLRLGGRSEAEAIEKLRKRYESLQQTLNQTTVEDVFDIYMNVIATRFDPHSGYLSPRNTEDFDISMSLSLEGIGATLSANEEGKIKIRELVVGGPAYKSGKLHINDQIIGVAQGEDGAMQDVVGMRLDKAVSLIRGKKGTIVRLLIEPAQGNLPEQEIRLERDTIRLEEQAAQGYIETLQENGVEKKMGVIRLPSFYLDFEAARKGGKEYRSTSQDMAKILENMKAENVEGIIVDLRGNGGGSLYEVVQTVGLFIDQGPVVMVSTEDGKIETQKDENAGALYDGPLVVLIDQGSASASEIFAAAIQDYQRGVIIGSNSFGKGTVQTIMALEKFVRRNHAALGEMRVTVAMFHRVNGESTQNKGVVPDIALPSSADIEQVGERSLPYALAMKTIQPAEFRKSGQVNAQVIQALAAKHQERMAQIPALKRYQEYMEKFRQETQKRDWSLNYLQREQDYQNWKKYVQEYEQKQAEETPALKSDEKTRQLVETHNKSIENEEEKEHFVPDTGLFEALHILFDLIQYAQEQPLDKAA